MPHRLPRYSSVPTQSTPTTTAQNPLLKSERVTASAAWNRSEEPSAAEIHGIQLYAATSTMPTITPTAA